MIASLSAWFPAVNLSCPLMRKTTQGAEKLKWTPDLESEYLITRKIMKKEIRLSPYNPDKWLNLVIDGASSRGIGFLCYQLVDEDDPSKGANIIQAGASLLPANLGFSPVDGELAALAFACKETSYFLVNCPKLRLLSDCSGLVQMMAKDLIKIKNPKHHRILASIQHIVFAEVVHIPGSINTLADCLSRRGRR